MVPSITWLGAVNQQKAVPRVSCFLPLSSLLLPGEVLAHVRTLQIYVASAGGDAVRDRAGHRLALDAQVPLVGLELRGDGDRAAALAALHDLEQVDRTLRRCGRRHEAVDQQKRDGLVVRSGMSPNIGPDGRLGKSMFGNANGIMQRCGNHVSTRTLLNSRKEESIPLAEEARDDVPQGEGRLCSSR